MKIIDVHTHPCFHGSLMSEEFRVAATENGIDFTLEGFLKEMDDNGVERAVAISESGQGDPHVAALKSDRILPAIAVDYRVNDKQFLKTLEAALSNGIFKAIKLWVGYYHFAPNERKCLPIYNLAQRYAVPIIIHTGDTWISVTKKCLSKVRYSHPLHVDEVAVEFPEVKFVLAHSGNPWIDDASELAYKNENVFVDISGWFLGEISGPYARLMLEKLNFIVAYTGCDKILYGSDWPLVRMEPYIRFVKEAGLSEQDLRKVFYDNALRVFWKH